jgi:polysaccharide export outer membrane protein
MPSQRRRKFSITPLLAMVLLCQAGSGCKTIIPVDAPTEMSEVILPDYRIGPPDVLLIDAANLVPRPPYRIAPLDGLLIRVTILDPQKDQLPNQLLKGQPIDGLYRVDVAGELDLGFDYGSVRVAKLTIPEARAAFKKHLQSRFKVDFDISVALAESRALQQIRGEHLVRQDGKVTLGIYGSVNVDSMTVEEAKLAIETHLAKYLFEPEISLDVAGYNSKVYYVIVDLGAAGQSVNRLPVTGNETVLDAIGEIKGLPGGTDRKRIWIARRSGPGTDCGQVLPVDWQAVVCGGSTATNYQIIPGDRIYVSVDRWIALDQCLAKVISPFERILGVTLLGSSTIHSVALPLNGGTTTNGGGITP